VLFNRKLREFAQIAKANCVLRYRRARGKQDMTGA
jgi:hypothetical protein